MGSWHNSAGAGSREATSEDMTDYTEHYGWAKPTLLDLDGFPEWASELNGNLDDQDSLINTLETTQATIDQRVTTNRQDIDALDPDSDAVVSEAEYAWDSDLFDGLDSSQFLRSDADDTTDGRLTSTVGMNTPELNGAVTGNTALTSLAGANLDIDASGVLNATDTRADVSDDGALVLDQPTTINFTDNLTATDDGAGGVTVSASDTNTDTDTRTNISDDGTAVVSNTTDINFATNLSVTDDNDGSVTIDASGGGSGSGTTTTLYMSDYVAGGVCDTEFDTAISDASPHDTIVFDHNSYELQSSHTITKPLTIKGVDSTITYTNTSNNNPAILFQGGGLGSSTTTVNAENKGARVLEVNDASLFSAGGHVMVMDGTHSAQANNQMQFQRVASVDTTAGTITLSGGLYRPFPSGSTVYVVDLLDRPRMVDIETTGGGYRHLQFQWCHRPEFRNCAVSEYLEVSLYALDSWKPRWYNCEATDPEGLASGEGEPLACYRCSDAYIESPRIEDCRRGIDLAWGSHDVEIVDPVIRGVSLAGISVHQDDIAGRIEINGGVMSCDPNGQSGHCISTSSTAITIIEGMTLHPRSNGILANGVTHASDCYIEPVNSGGNGNGGIHIQGSNMTFDNIHIVDDSDQLVSPVWFDAPLTDSGAIENVSVDDVTIERPGTDHIYLDARDAGTSITGVEVDGFLDADNGTSDQGIWVRADAGTISDAEFSVKMYRFPNQAVRLYTEDVEPGVIEHIWFHDCYFDCGLAAIYTDGGSAAGNFPSTRVSDCNMDTGGTSLSFNESTVDKLIIVNNILNGSIDASGTSNTTISGNL